MKMQFISLVSLFVVGAMAGKYSKEMNEKNASDKSNNQVEFRIAKLNQVWEKAIRVRYLTDSKPINLSLLQVNRL